MRLRERFAVLGLPLFNRLDWKNPLNSLKTPRKRVTAHVVLGGREKS